jgi:hypothetical protein
MLNLSPQKKFRKTKKIPRKIEFNLCFWKYFSFQHEIFRIILLFTTMKCWTQHCTSWVSPNLFQLSRHFFIPFECIFCRSVLSLLKQVLKCAFLCFNVIFLPSFATRIWACFGLYISWVFHLSFLFRFLVVANVMNVSLNFL